MTFANCAQLNSENLWWSQLSAKHIQWLADIEISGEAPHLHSGNLHIWMCLKIRYAPVVVYDDKPWDLGVLNSWGNRVYMLEVRYYVKVFTLMFGTKPRHLLDYPPTKWIWKTCHVDRFDRGFPYPFLGNLRLCRWLVSYPWCRNRGWGPWRRWFRRQGTISPSFWWAIILNLLVLESMLNILNCSP